MLKGKGTKSCGRVNLRGFAECRVVQEHGVGTAVALLVVKPWGQQKVVIGNTCVALTVFNLLCKYWL